MEKAFGTKVTLNVIADLDMKVANLYGLIHPVDSTTQNSYWSQRGLRSLYNRYKILRQS